jgi:transposase
MDLHFIQKLIGLQGIEVLYSNVNNDTFEVFAKSSASCVICPRCGNTTHKIHDRRYQEYTHLPIWGMNTSLFLEIKRYYCDCKPSKPFDEPFDFI